MVGGLLRTTDDVGQGVAELPGRAGEDIGGVEIRFRSGTNHMWSKYSWRRGTALCLLYINWREVWWKRGRGFTLGGRKGQTQFETRLVWLMEFRLGPGPRPKRPNLVRHCVQRKRLGVVRGNNY